MSFKRKALFPGSFDPFTNGHLDTVKRGAGLFDELTIAVMTNTNKQSLFTETEKIALIEDAVKQFENVHVMGVQSGLTVDLMKKKSISYLVRGIRSVKDFEYERDISYMNHMLNAEIETIFLLADQKYSFVSSSLVREVAQFGGDISELVTPKIEKALHEKF